MISIISTDQAHPVSCNYHRITMFPGKSKRLCFKMAPVSSQVDVTSSKHHTKPTYPKRKLTTFRFRSSGTTKSNTVGVNLICGNWSLSSNVYYHLELLRRVGTIQAHDMVNATSWYDGVHQSISRSFGGRFSLLRKWLVLCNIVNTLIRRIQCI